MQDLNVNVQYNSETLINSRKNLNMRVRISSCLIVLMNSMVICSSESSFIFETDSLPSDLGFMPTIGNGELGFTVFSNSVHANGVYNGANGLSHRARIPNCNNIQIKVCAVESYDKRCKFSMNVRHGVFQVKYTDPENTFKIVQTIYAHRFYNRAIVNQIDVYRLTNASVCVLWNHVPEEITIPSEKNVSLSFLMVVDGNFSKAKAEMIDVLELPHGSLLQKHKDEWEAFWDFNIEIEGNNELNSIVHASIFYIFCSLPSLNTNQATNVFYGLSPTGLGRGGSDLNDYEGHNFWDSEIFLQPFIGLVNPKWVKFLLNYRHMKIGAAKSHATNTGYLGARFPWESAFTGTEVTQPSYSGVAKFQIHISADISFAIRNYFALTHELSLEICELADEIAKFYLSRLTFNNVTGFYDINGVMGPDEDHENVDNNVYTNVGAAYAIYFGSFLSCLCNSEEHDAWLKIAKKIQLLYEPTLDYHPQFAGYQIGTSVKQADAILLNYPLQFRMKNSTKFNDLRIYQNVTRSSGPAMTNAMASIGYLDVGILEYASKMFEKGYKPYVRKPFYVWAELSANEDGAKNFLTGSGGFLQSIMNGFIGLRYNITHLRINRSYLLPNTTGFTSNFSYMQSYFMIRVERGSRMLTCLKLNSVKPLKIQIGSETPDEMITEKYNYNIQNETVVILPVNENFGNCKIPTDEMGNQTNLSK